MKINAIFIWVTLLWACTGCGAVSASDSGQTPVRHVVVIPVAGEVGPAMAAFIERTLDQGAEQYDNALYVLEMDTFGGRVDSAFQIVETLLNKPRGKTIAYVKKRPYLPVRSSLWRVMSLP